MADTRRRGRSPRLAAPVSIAPPSDIILDVAQAADPQRLQAATTKLNALATSSGGTSVDFQSLLAEAQTASKAGAAPKSPAPTTLASAHAGTLNPKMSPYRKFEAVLLQTFVQEMLPKDDHLFGDGASADACRSMLAEQLAGQLAKSGRLGIAQMIEKAHAGQAHDAAAQASGALAPDLASVTSRALAAVAPRSAAREAPAAAVPPIQPPSALATDEA